MTRSWISGFVPKESDWFSFMNGSRRQITAMNRSNARIAVPLAWDVRFRRSVRKEKKRKPSPSPSKTKNNAGNPRTVGNRGRSHEVPEATNRSRAGVWANQA
ncbi:hypothetical protein ACVIJU_001669 [Aeribacillus sp. SP014]